MSSLLNVLQESARETATGDVNFLQKSVYFFELRLPQNAVATANNTFFFPLVLNPTQITLGEPFTLEPTFTMGGGIYVEENGILARSLRIRGNTGWKPREMKGDTYQVLSTPPAGNSYSRVLPAIVTAAISGQRHLQYLQDAVFRTYADFKRDPSTAKETQLIFHNPRENEDWLVAPRNFTLDQSVGAGRTMYNYDIDLLVLDKADSTDKTFSEDKSLLDEIKNAVATVQSAIALAQGALNDLTQLAAALKGVINDFSKIVDSVTSVVAAAQNFVLGVTSLIQAPYALITSTAELIESSLGFYNSLVTAGTIVDTVPAPILESIRQLQDSMHLVGVHPESFETPAQAQIRAYKASQQIAQANTPAALAAAAQTSLTSFQQVNNLGTALLPGDQQRAKAQFTSGSATVNYTGAQQYSVAQGDTLVNLAARFLGDARQWQYIATLNGLKPPFVDVGTGTQQPTAEIALSGSVGIGQQILIPNFSTPPSAQPLLPILGVPSTASAAEHLLGCDLLMAPAGQTNPSLVGSSREQLDFVVDREQGAVDLKRVRGVPNLAQALLLRTLTEKGTDILFTKLGIVPIVSLNVTAIDSHTARFRIQESWLADPRVSAVTRVDSIQGDTPDTIVIDADVSVRGFTQAVTVQIPIS